MGGDMSPMGDMGADPMGGAPDPMGGDMPMDDPAMGGDMGADPMGGESPDMPEGDGGMAPEGGNSEIDGVFNQLGTEDQASVLKYAKSMLKNSDSGEGMPPAEPDMQAESVKHIKGLVTEIVNDILGSNEEGTDRPDTTIRNKRAVGNSPFVTKY